MNRTEEYKNLLSELCETPPALEFAVARARTRAKRTRVRRRIAVPLGSFVSVLAAFVLFVNVSVPFARACGRVPVLRELASAVAFSPSLSAAVEHEYVQPVLQEQEANGIKMRVEYVIVDQKQLNIFYTLDSDTYPNLDATPSIKAADGAPLEGYSLSSGYGQGNGALRRITADFVDADLPGSLNLTCRVFDREAPSAAEPVRADDAILESPEPEEPEALAVFTFPLTFDPAFTRQGEVYEIGQTFQLEEQRFTAETLEVYPTHVRLNLRDDPGNSAWLKSLSFYLEDEKGRRYEAVGNGISATGSPDSPMMNSYRLESTFFSGSRHLKLIVTGAVLLDKSMERVRVDLASGTADTLPEGVTLKEAVRVGESWRLTFTAPAHKENGAYQLFGTDYYDPAGNRHEYNSWSTMAPDGQAGEGEAPGVFEVRFALIDYPYDTVSLSPMYSRSVTPETPVSLEIK